MTLESLQRLIDCATSRRPADLVFKNARVVDVFSQTIVRADVAVAEGYICGLGAYHGVTEVDLNGAYLAPGFIDAHVHIESSLATPAQFARLVLPRGTTTVIADPHEIANVCGVDGVDFMLSSADGVPLDVRIMAPSCVPASAVDHGGAELDAAAVHALLQRRGVHGIGEMMDFPAVVAADTAVVAKLLPAYAAGVLVDGHAPMVEGRALNAYAAAGIRTDHECSTVEELRERVARGMYVLLRHGSAARNLETLIQGVDGTNARRCMFCTDDKEPQHIADEGHIDACIRLAITAGLDPIMAITMATLNAAEAYRLYDRGALAPGRRADLVVLDDLRSCSVMETYVAGRAVARNGAPLFAVREKVPGSVLNTVRLPQPSADALRVQIEGNYARVIHADAGSLITPAVTRRVQIDAHGTIPDGLLKLAVFERHNGAGAVGVALVENLGIRGGAIAGTIAHDSHHLIVAGDNDTDMLEAVAALRTMGGGLVVCARTRVVARVSLPIAGLLTDAPVEETVQAMRELLRAAETELGVDPASAPFMTLSFLALPVIPHLKLTPHGLYDLDQGQFVTLSVDPSDQRKE